MTKIQVFTLVFSCHRLTFQGAFHVVNSEDLRHEIELLLGIAAYSLLPLHGGATLFCFTRHKCWRNSVIYNYYKLFHTRLLMSI